MNKHEELDIAILSALLKCKVLKLNRTVFVNFILNFFPNSVVKTFDSQDFD